ncbi:hypothetical protein F0P96_11120 [Hymenobacter busanensis]|uniref:Uncharacterized protein n=1 Tax=Hymenobacter busanensis TaxID=2607656 RepID=A0A7L4ZX68_9BACT|nr:hypothetical protein [Hymenobacter busanensis]KAA9332035.1 hypothetical protein F0P96_11120 [Hymenobacter busanensis]QHJ07627.1 hypothetical protein GUY19_10155 [Hymenobacter busanensis]
MPAYHIGCSSYHYRHWRGRFYPEKLPMRRWFEFYSQHFGTLELPPIWALLLWPLGFRQVCGDV